MGFLISSNKTAIERLRNFWRESGLKMLSKNTFEWVCKLSSGNRCNNPINYESRWKNDLLSRSANILSFRYTSSLHVILRIFNRVANAKMSLPRWLRSTSPVALRQDEDSDKLSSGSIYIFVVLFKSRCEKQQFEKNH